MVSVGIERSDGLVAVEGIGRDDDWFWVDGDGEGSFFSCCCIQIDPGVEGENTTVRRGGN